MWGCSKEIPKLNIQSAMSCVIQRDSSSPGLPAGTAPPQAGDMAPRSLAALFICLLRRGEQMDAPRPPTPNPAPLSLTEPALPHSAARRTPAQAAGRGGRAGARLRGGGEGRGSGALQGPPPPHTGSEAPPPDTHTHRPPSASMTRRGFGARRSGLCVCLSLHIPEHGRDSSSSGPANRLPPLLPPS